MGHTDRPLRCVVGVGCRGRRVLVVDFNVAVQIAFDGEGEPARRARMLPGGVVDNAVPRQIPPHSEPFTTDIAHVLFLAGVHRHVTQHPLLEPESLPAVRTLMREIICVNFSMNAQ